MYRMGYIKAILLLSEMAHHVVCLLAVILCTCSVTLREVAGTVGLKSSTKGSNQKVEVGGTSASGCGRTQQNTPDMISRQLQTKLLSCWPLSRFLDRPMYHYSHSPHHVRLPLKSWVKISKEIKKERKSFSFQITTPHC